MKTEARFKAVDLHELRSILGARCSPDPGRSGYVIGPDINGRLCHIASCRNIEEAKKYASKLNGVKAHE